MARTGAAFRHECQNYPDGQEILLRELSAMARYRDGFDKPAPLEPGKTVRLAFDCNSIAAVFNKGHRIGIFMTSSSSPAYEVPEY